MQTIQSECARLCASLLTCTKFRYNGIACKPIRKWFQRISFCAIGLKYWMKTKEKKTRFNITSFTNIDSRSLSRYLSPLYVLRWNRICARWPQLLCIRDQYWIINKCWLLRVKLNATAQTHIHLILIQYT